MKWWQELTLDMAHLSILGTYSVPVLVFMGGLHIVYNYLQLAGLIMVTLGTTMLVKQWQDIAIKDLNDTREKLKKEDTP